ncbi:MA3 DOMAIN-CONTAINING TRANSLATION REGULATORY FACTOR 1-like isoform X2 [Rosa rugosa]|uniref:MA3 DOMAIN-CONTAINING TRANSLATION REGULATORY FACTOR 1-like isoform X2 n=1 Tax=Rosa rugosa TaxID=74645 RepID=UPI002B40E6EC|nr:MA3 DOMAIN-CONTAINING TRANSLATION REGULATORY FACTOR 1-like isoform X2 [Rosa rugosa]
MAVALPYKIPHFHFTLSLSLAILLLQPSTRLRQADADADPKCDYRMASSRGEQGGTRRNVDISSSTPKSVLSANATPPAGVAVRNVGQTHSRKPVKRGGGGMGPKLFDADAESQIYRNVFNNHHGKLVRSTGGDPSDEDEYNKDIAYIVREYFRTGNIIQAAWEVRGMSNQYHPYFVKGLVSMAMSSDDEKKEISSSLLSALYADVISPVHIEDGFNLLLHYADVLDAVDILPLFLGRAVVDSILPSDFITRAKEALPESSKGFQIMQTAEENKNFPPYSPSFVGIWGGRTLNIVQKLEKQIDSLLMEYTKSRDALLTCKDIRKVVPPFYEHHFVAFALIACMKNWREAPHLICLLKEATGVGVISSSQMVKGFIRVEERLAVLVLHYSSAENMFQSLVSKAVSDGWLDNSLLESFGKDFANFPRDGMGIGSPVVMTDDGFGNTNTLTILEDAQSHLNKHDYGLAWDLFMEGNRKDPHNIHFSDGAQSCAWKILGASPLRWQWVLWQIFNSEKLVHILEWVAILADWKSFRGLTLFLSVFLVVCHVCSIRKQHGRVRIGFTFGKILLAFLSGIVAVIGLRADPERTTHLEHLSHFVLLPVHFLFLIFAYRC